jgi:replication factor C subunit 1
MPFMKASSVFAPKKLTKEVPDIEEAMGEDPEEEVAPANGDPVDEEDNDLAKDKFIKAPKKKAAPRAAKGKKRVADDDAEESEPKKAKGKGAKARK